MLALFYAYLATIIGKALALALLMNGLVALVGRYWRPIEIPKRVVFWGSIVVVFLAGFQAWREEHEKIEKLQPTRLVELEAQVARLSAGRWPNLDDVGKSDLLAEILTIRPHRVSFTCNDANCIDLTDDLIEVIRRAESAGWTFGESGVWIVGVAEGLAVSSSPQDPDVKLLAAALQRILHWPVGVHDDENLPAHEFLVIVGLRKARR